MAVQRLRKPVIEYIYEKAAVCCSNDLLSESSGMASTSLSERVCV